MDVKYASRKFILALVFAGVGGLLSFKLGEPNLKAIVDLLIGLYFVYAAGNVGASYAWGKTVGKELKPPLDPAKPEGD